MSYEMKHCPNFDITSHLRLKHRTKRINKIAEVVFITKTFPNTTPQLFFFVLYLDELFINLKREKKSLITGDHVLQELNL